MSTSPKTTEEQKEELQNAAIQLLIDECRKALTLLNEQAKRAETLQKMNSISYSNCQEHLDQIGSQRLQILRMLALVIEDKGKPTLWDRIQEDDP